MTISIPFLVLLLVKELIVQKFLLTSLHKGQKKENIEYCKLVHRS